MTVADPLDPSLTTVTPVDAIAALSTQDRQRRVTALIAQARDITHQAIVAHSGGKEIGAVCILWSGGKDSTTLAHLVRDQATHVIHANTGIGIEETRQFVRDQAAAWGLALVERHPPAGCSYRELVLDQGFPGPSQHYKMYQRLKERTLDAVRRDIIGNVYRRRLIYFAGRRRQESVRRAEIPLHERDGSAIWISPLANWTALDINTYHTMFPDIPRNLVTDLLHMSGECLCGAFAKKGELDMIREWYPDTADDIDRLEHDVRAAGHPEPVCRWGWGAYRTPRDRGPRSLQKAGRLCSSCTAPDEPES